MYADFAYYRGTYFGTTIEEKDWPRLATRAGEYLDYITLGAAAANADLPQLKNACCAIADVIAQQDAKLEQSGGLQSQSVGSWSVSYQSPEEIGAEKDTLMRKAAYSFLASTGLLYRGGGCR